MLKKLRSECIIQLEISTDGPLLIKSGQTFATATDCDMTAVRTMRNGRWEVYLPGSSLKGALRAHAERIARTLAQNGYGCCDPFSTENQAAGQFTLAQACSERLKNTRKEQDSRQLNTRWVYRESCPICKLFGCLSIAGRLAFNDAYLVKSDVDDLANKIASRSRTIPPEQLPREIKNGLSSIKPGAAFDITPRHNVGIDRHTGGASSGSLFKLEVVTAATFTTMLYLRNFELWQLGLLAFVLRDLENGVIKLGMGKSRGLGRIKATVSNIEIHYLGLAPPPAAGTPCELRGMRLLEPAEGDYEFWDSEQAAMPLYDQAGPPADAVKAASDEYGLRTIYSFNQAQCAHLWRKAAPLWVSYARENPHATSAVGSGP